MSKGLCLFQNKIPSLQGVIGGKMKFLYLISLFNTDYFFNWFQGGPLLKKTYESMDFVPILLTPHSPLKFGSKNRYQSPVTVPRLLSLYYQNEYQKSLDSVSKNSLQRTIDSFRLFNSICSNQTKLLFIVFNTIKFINIKTELRKY